MKMTGWIPSRTLAIPALVASGLLGGCVGAPAAAGGGDSEGPSALALEAAKLAVSAAAERLAAAEKDLAIQQEANRLALEAAASELRQAEMRLNLLDTVDGKKRADEAQLQVRQSKDAIEDAADELEQLKKMYGENELADATKEIVIKRGERQLVRAREHLSIQEANLAKVLGEITVEREKLVLEHRQKREEKEQAAAKAESLAHQKRAALADAQAALKKAQDELEQLRKKSGQGAPAAGAPAR